ncbi:hypothetical protein QBE52_06825 [Clostridiaceae bacterium 35-E11]
MKILRFRPYKRYADEMLLEHIYEVFERLNKEQSINQQSIIQCDELILEAKHRNLHCPKERLYKKVLFR